MKQFVEEHVYVDKAFKKHYQGALPGTLEVKQGEVQDEKQASLVQRPMDNVRGVQEEAIEITKPGPEHELEKMINDDERKDEAPVPILIPFRAGI